MTAPGVCAVLVLALAMGCPSSQGRGVNLAAQFEIMSGDADVVHGEITGAALCVHEPECAPATAIEVLTFAADWVPDAARLDHTQPALFIRAADAQPLALGVSGYYTFIQFGPLIEEDAGFSVTCGDDVAQTGWRYLTALAATDDHVAEYASSHAEIRDAVERGTTGESVGAMIQLGLRCSE